MEKRSLAGAWFLTGTGLLIALAGALFTWLLWLSYARAQEIGHWPEVPCTILKSEPEHRQIAASEQIESRFSVLYGYVWQGVPYESTRWKLRGAPWSSRPDHTRDLEEKYPVGLQTVCRIDPQNPAMAVLEGESRGPGYSLWFPLLFVAGGTGIMIGAWRKPKARVLPARES